MRFIAFGDSFVEGTIMKGPHTNYQNVKACNEISFVNHVKGFDSVHNIGAAGASNEMIAHAAYKYLQKETTINETILVAWSGMWRFAYYNTVTGNYVHINRKINKQSYRDPIFLVDSFIPLLYHQAQKTNRKIFFTSSFVSYPAILNAFSPTELKAYNYILPMHFRNTLFDIITLRFKSQRISRDGVMPEQLDSLHTNLKGDLDKETMFDIQDNKFVAPCNHPTPEGHKLIAKTLQPYIS